MANIPSGREAITMDDLLAIEARVEIIDGEIVEMPVAGGMHHLIVGNIIRILDRYVYEKKIGVVFPDGMTYLMHSTTKDLKDSYMPDLSFIQNENIPKDWDVEKPHPGVPDLAVEVVSPNDNAELLEAKAVSYLQKGAAQVWLVYPKTRRLHQYQYTEDLAETVTIYAESQKIEADGLFPGIEGLMMDAIFDLPPWAIKEK